MKKKKGSEAKLFISKIAKKLSVIICTALFLFSSVLPVSAAEPIIDISPGRDNLFENMTNMLPGTSMTDYFTIKNISKKTCFFYLQTRDVSGTEFISTRGQNNSTTLLSILDMRIVLHQAGSKNEIRSAGVLLYEGKANQADPINGTALLGNEVFLGELGAGNAVVIEVTVSVPEHLDNSYKEMEGKFWWSFTAQEKPADSKPPSSISQGNPKEPENPVQPNSTLPVASSSRTTPISRSISAAPTSSSGANAEASNDKSGGEAGGGTNNGSNSGGAVAIVNGESTSLNLIGSGTAITSGPVLSIGDNDVPFYGEGTVWALLNLILAIACFVGSVVMVIGVFARRKREQEEIAEDGEETNAPKRRSVLVWRGIAIASGILAPIVFMITERITHVMVLTDKWTLLMVNIAIFQFVFILIARKASHEKEEAPEVEEYGG